MPLTFVIFAVLTTLILPALIATVVFFGALNWWIEAILQSDAAASDHPKLEVSEDRVTWVFGADLGEFKRCANFPLLCSMLAAFAATAIETFVFALSSPVPFLWCSSGLIASIIAPPGLLAAAGLLRDPLARFVRRTSAQRANDKFTYAAETILEIRDIVQEIDKSSSLIGMAAQAGVLEDCETILVSRSSFEHDTALAELIGVKIRLEYDLRWIKYLAHLFDDALIALTQAKIPFHGMTPPPGAIEQINDLLHSKDLTDALKDRRWVDAGRVLEDIRADIGRLSDAGYRAGALPKTTDDAYRILNVSSETPTAKIKAVVKAYWQVWHPDVAPSDEIERFECVVRLQQINAAWEVIQTARSCGQEAQL